MNRDEKGRFLPKSELSVEQAVLLAYNEQPKIWHGVIFVIDVRLKLFRPMCPDGTIFRALRQLRSDGLLNYGLKNKENSIYQKLDVIKSTE